MRVFWLSIGAALAASPVAAQTAAGVSPEEKSEIQALAQRYGAALGSCDAAAFADLFEPKSGVFASGFRGRVEGRDKLVALVESERHCRAPSADANGGQARPGARPVPEVSLTRTAAGLSGTIDLGGAGQYQDEYVRTPDGWRFASRTVITPPERAAGVDATEMAAIRALSADVPVADHYDTDDRGKRFLSSGVVIRVDAGTVGGRVHLADGGHYDDVYEKTAAGTWRIRSRTRVAAGN